MGSRVSKAVRQLHRDVESPSVVTPIDREEKMETFQDMDYERLEGGVAASSINHSVPYPHPIDTTSMDPGRVSIGLQPTATHGDLMEIPQNVTENEPLPLSHPDPPRPHTPSPQCLICCNEIDEKNKHQILTPCKCGNTYCPPCLKDMFVAACKDITRMPPRCCTQIPLYHARPYLSAEEAAEFRAKYEEWSTPKPFYCPVARCSAFIPNRLLPQVRTNSKGKQRVDSGVGTPTSPTVSCPNCKVDICTKCRSLAHTGGTCLPLEWGIDKDTAELLERWGYKRCPKCSHGVKRMFGCNHMECRCGAHFCWVCLQDKDECDGGCYEDSDNGDEDYENDEHSDRENDDGESHQEEANNPNTTAPEANSIPHIQQPSTQSIPTTEQSTNPSQPALKSPLQARNLDGGSARYWEQQDLNFGDEPTDDVQDRAWSCSHNFNTAKMKLADAFNINSAPAEMECMKCWIPVHLEVEMPSSLNIGAIKTVSVSATIHDTRGRVQNVRSRLRASRYVRRTRLRAVQSLEVLQGQSTPALTRPSTHHGESMEPVEPTDPMEDVQYHSQEGSEQVRDMYGNIITMPGTTEGSQFPSFGDVFDKEPHNNDKIDPFVFRMENEEPTRSFSMAYHCSYCGVFVCHRCKDTLLDEAAMIKDQA